MRRHTGGLVVVAIVAITACGSSDDLDLADLSDRTVPAEEATNDDDDVTGDATGGDDAPRDTDDDDAPDSGFGRDELGAFINTCAVLTPDEVAAATGLTVITSEETPGFGCTWFVESVDAGIIADDAIVFQPFPAEQLDAQRAAVDQGLAGEEIEGLGIAAVYIGTEALGEVWVLLDDLSFRVVNQFAFTEFDGRPLQEALAASLADALR